MNLSRKYWYKIILLSCALGVVAGPAEAFDDDFDMSTITIEDLDAYEHDNPPDFSTLRLTADYLAGVLSNHITQPLFKNTKAPAGRDILYLLPHKITAVEFGGYALNFFFNMTDQMKVTAADLFNFVAQDKLVEFISGFIEGANEQEFEQLLPLFKKITLQERKSGVLLQSGFIKGPFTIQLNTSVQLGARNFWLNPSDADAIKEVFSEAGFADTEFDEHELYKIRVGMGDTRVKIGLNTINMTSFQTDIGFESILPTSRLSYTPGLQIGLSQTAFNPDEEEDLARSGLAAMRGVRDHLLNPRLGNDGHFGYS